MGRRNRRGFLVTALLLAAGGITILVLQPRGSPEERYRKLLERGTALMQSRRAAEAIPPLERATRILPREAEGHYELAWAHFLAQDSAAALTAIDAVLESPEHRDFVALSPQIADYHMLRARVALDLGRSGQARSDLERVVQLRPEDARAHIFLARTMRDGGDSAAARTVAAKAVESGLRTSESLTLMGMLDAELDRLEEAVGWLTEATEVSPGYTAAYHQLAQVFHKLGRRSEGERAAELAKRLAVADDEVAKFNNRIAMSQLSESRYLDFMETYGRYCLRYRKDVHLAEGMERLLLVEPDRAELHLYRGMAAGWLGQESRAAIELHRAVELQPGLAAAMSELALLLATAKDPAVRDRAEAVRWARRAVDGGGDADALVVALDAAGETGRAASLADWQFPPGEAWQALRRRRLEAFQRALLEDTVGPVLSDAQVGG